MSLPNDTVEEDDGVEHQRYMARFNAWITDRMAQGRLASGIFCAIVLVRAGYNYAMVDEMKNDVDNRMIMESESILPECEENDNLITKTCTCGEDECEPDKNKAVYCHTDDLGKWSETRVCTERICDENMITEPWHACTCGKQICEPLENTVMYCKKKVCLKTLCEKNQKIVEKPCTCGQKRCIPTYEYAYNTKNEDALYCSVSDNGSEEDRVCKPRITCTNTMVTDCFCGTITNNEYCTMACAAYECKPCNPSTCAFTCSIDGGCKKKCTEGKGNNSDCFCGPENNDMYCDGTCDLKTGVCKAYCTKTLITTDCYCGPVNKKKEYCYGAKTCTDGVCAYADCENNENKITTPCKCGVNPDCGSNLNNFCKMYGDNGNKLEKKICVETIDCDEKIQTHCFCGNTYCAKTCTNGVCRKFCDETITTDCWCGPETYCTTTCDNGECIH